MPTLETPDGKPVDVTPPDAETINAKFDAAMNDDGPDEAAPPRRQPRTAEPDAPKPRRGRAPKAEKSRTADKPAVAVKDDYTADAQQLVGGLWTVAASIPFTCPYALVVDANSDQFAAALAEGAKHNATIRSWVSAGENTWMLQLASVGMTMGLQAMQIAKDKELRAEAAAVTRDKLKKALKAQGIEIPEPAHEPAAA